ncbi:MAG: sigma 54-interacting transcriptional regulator [Desulfomonilaceae bacterium]
MKNDHFERLRFEAMIADMAATFVNLPAGEVDAHIESALQQLVEFLGFDRATLFQTPNDSGYFVGTHCWARPGIERRVGYHINDISWIYNCLTQQKKPVMLGSPADLPPEAEEFKIRMERLGLRSSVLIPLLAGATFVGFLAFGSFQCERSFPHDTLNRLRLVCSIFSSALQRRNDELSLKQALNEVRALKDQLEAENLSLREEVRTLQGYDRIIGKSKSIRRVLQQVKQVAETDSSVLILGETGTGKNLVALAIHENSPRMGRNLVCVNCAALPPSIIENELFGHEKGAFTGAVSKQLGRFEVADKSTIFLDEIGDLPLNVQAKLLRVLEDGRFERLGSHRTIEVNVRVVAATNRDLAKSVKNGTFREDLYYRLNVFPIPVPPLRNRMEDIPLLVEAYASEFSRRFGKKLESISFKDLKSLGGYSWPGNVRELRNVVERSVILAQSAVLRIKVPESPVSQDGSPLTLEEIERRHILDVLQQTRWRVSGQKGAAAILDIHPKTLESRMKKLGIHRPAQNPDI